MRIIRALFVGIIKSFMFIPINIKYSFSLKACEGMMKKTKRKGKKLSKLKWYSRLYYIFAGLIVTIIMIPVNFFLCARDSYRKK